MGKKSKMPTRDEFLAAVAGKTVSEQAALYGVSTATISIWRARLRVQRERRRRPARHELIEAGAGRMSDRDLARALGVSVQRARYWREQYGIPAAASRERSLQRPGEVSGALTIRLYRHERQELKERSEQAGVSVSAFVRAALFGEDEHR